MYSTCMCIGKYSTERFFHDLSADESNAVQVICSFEVYKLDPLKPSVLYKYSGFAFKGL